MIDRSTGTILFTSGLSFTPQGVLSSLHLGDARIVRMEALPGWGLHRLGLHDSDHGRFMVEAVSDPARRVQTVLLVHFHPFYRPGDPEDGERRAFHEGVVSTDLGGQREFSWGQVFCRLDNETNTDHLVIVYRPGPNVPMHPPETLFQLRAHADESESA